jgi:hypothetical protein
MSPDCHCSTPGSVATRPARSRFCGPWRASNAWRSIQFARSTRHLPSYAPQAVGPLRVAIQSRSRPYEYPTTSLARRHQRRRLPGACGRNSTSTTATAPPAATMPALPTPDIRGLGDSISRVVAHTTLPSRLASIARVASDKVVQVFHRIAGEYPVGLREAERAEVARQAFHVTTALRLAPGGRIADVGGGIGLFSVACAALSAPTILIDDFADPVNEEYGDALLDLHRSYGVKVVRRDVVTDGLGMEPESLDLFASFDSIEHWHNSPKAVAGCPPDQAAWASRALSG